MMKKRKFKKGDIEYILKRKKNTALRTILLFGVAFAVLGIGYFGTGSIQNYFTIIAMLGMLPAARSAVEMIVTLRVQQIDEHLYHEVEEITRNTEIKVIYNLYFTSEKRNYPVEVLLVTNNCIVGYKSNPAYEIKDLRSHIETYLRKDGFEPSNIQIFHEKSKFISALKNNSNKKLMKKIYA